MAPVISTVRQLVNENSVAEFMTASEILIKFADNVLQRPSEPKYRKIRLGNPTVESKLLTVSGAMECLFEMGFAEDGEFLSLPMAAPLAIISQIKTQLQLERSVIEKSQTTGASQPQSAAPGRASAGQTPLSTQTGPPGAHGGASVLQPSSNLAANMFQSKEADFFRKLQSQLQHVLCYEDKRLQQKARETIPVRQLQDEAQQKLAMFNEANTAAGSGDDSAKLDIQDCLVLALLNWFKTSFFKWVDSPACKHCGAKTQGVGSAQATPEEVRFGGNRVENYRCTVCQGYTRFVRYNDPGKLLETREGRCGEWANCFTLCCRALGFEARYVLDWTDHVWTEVYSNSQQRWVHCDPCENTCDKPLLYEKGWGKKLTYVIAFSVDDVEDVTWRYTSNFEAIRSRRNECRENWLVKTLYNLDKQKWSAMPETKRNIRLKRKIVELVEFMTPKEADGQNLSGRTTGSVAWRVARGEIGRQSASSTQPYIFTPTQEEISQKILHVAYSCAQDKYTEVSRGGQKSKGYESRLHKQENILRKEEHDWKMVYLARTEGSSKAEVAWKFDFAGSGLHIDKIEVRVDSAVYENGKINWMICSDETCALLKSGPTLQTVSELNGQTGFTLTASLSGGKGDVAWQHTQLFRQSSEDKTTCPFEVKVTLK